MKVLILFLALFFGSVFVEGQSDTPQFVPNSYIVKIKDDRDLKKNFDKGKGREKKLIKTALYGYTVKMTEAEAEETKLNPDVEFVEQDMYAYPTEVTSAWNLDRIDQRYLPLNGDYTTNYNGQGVTAYIMDSGINYAHEEFEGRASLGYDATGGDGSDCIGHGTHVAGTVGGKTYGVAKAVTLKSVKIAGCSLGSTGAMINGLNYIAENAQIGSVVNISYILSGTSTSLDVAVNNVYSRGIHVVVSSGNNNTDACLRSPTSALGSFSTSATASDDSRAGYSNWGTCVDIHAPGNSIPSASYADNTSVRYMSGTSMASPAVAGIFAQYAQARPFDAPSYVASFIKSFSTQGILTNVPDGEINNLAFNGFTLDPNPVNFGDCSATFYGGGLLEGGSQLVKTFTLSNRSDIIATIISQYGASSSLSLEKQTIKGKKSHWAVVSSGSSINTAVSAGTYRLTALGTTGSGAYGVCSNI
jgi:subtilisin family serine protease